MTKIDLLKGVGILALFWATVFFVVWLVRRALVDLGNDDASD